MRAPIPFVFFLLLIAGSSWAGGAREGPSAPPPRGEDAGLSAQVEAGILQRRIAMVERQIAARGVTDPLVLRALRTVPRDRFVPRSQRPYAYEDRPLPIGFGQTISQPYIVAYMTEQLGLHGGERVLEIGTGSGYQAAVLAEVGAEVYSIEIIAELSEQAGRSLAEAGYPAVRRRVADGYYGWSEEAPFDAMIVTAAADHVPPPLVDQLAEGGRMIIPLGPPNGIQTLLLLTKGPGGSIERRSLLAVRFVPMTGRAQQ